mmetsp:Transcript_50699/g.87203  ORF Transcript_50699/g.87203 Transcript_50699/m.87203 type:complete len:83 (+) Transcript_50699:115-363(+)
MVALKVVAVENPSVILLSVLAGVAAAHQTACKKTQKKKGPDAWPTALLLHGFSSIKPHHIIYTLRCGTFDLASAITNDDYPQ